MFVILTSVRLVEIAIMSRLCYLLPLIAYFYGAVPFGLLMVRKLKGMDLRQVGSGNIGATNAARSLGLKFFPLIFLLDFSKGSLPTLLAMFASARGSAFHPPPLAVCTGIAAILGHVFPVYLRFRGGKGVATSTGVFVVLAPWAVAAAFVVWVVVFGLWRYVSLASISAATVLLGCVWAQPDRFKSQLFLTVFVTIGVLLVIALHRANIKRLLSGTESKVGRKLAVKPTPPCGPDVGGGREKEPES